MAVIQLTQNKFTTIDDDDYDYFSQRKWYFSSTGYAVRSDRGKKIYLHREISKTPDGMVTDHVNRNRLDNRRSNLISCDRSQNARNTEVKPAKSGFVGVYPCKKKWRARIKFNGAMRHIGTFDTPTQAAQAWDKFCRDNLKGYTKLNFGDTYGN